ncbi:MAG: hypothetical protein HY390_01020 [Deltaproteobacteria bacterium]|nr:hypothetical protein [Deltaproteobacteria bacterium]
MAKNFDIRVILDRVSQLSLDTTTLQRYFWVLHLIIIFLLAKSVSNLVVSYIDNKIQTPIQEKKTALPRLTETEQTSYPPFTDFQVIRKRNIFNPFAKEEDEATLAQAGRPKIGLDIETAVPSSLTLELVGTIILTDPTKSVAAIMDKSQNQTESYSAQDIVSQKAKIIKIEPARVYFENQETASVEYIEVKEGAPDTTPPYSAGASSPELAGGIRQAGEGRFIIDRSALEGTLANPNEILTQARAVPNIVGGKIQGFKIFSIKPGSLYEKLGIQNGDTVERVNGVDMDSPSKALEFYGAITQAKEISLDVERAGKKMTFNYEIR